MKAKGKFISFLLVVDTFFVAYAYGFHSRQVLVVDPKLPPVVPAKALEKTVSPEKNKGVIRDATSHRNAVVAPLSKRSDLKKSTAKDKAVKDRAADKKASKDMTAAKAAKPALKKTINKATTESVKAKEP
ncbi:MAG: hypothetical protein Q8T09_11755 [Candidatus Melainabacteria bacterium]|nr:hypothetical protein [Candidatus Melainabacteria bacterium]